jgi:hypothetical protein
MSVPIFLHIYSNGDIWFTNDVSKTPTSTQESGTLVTSIRVNSDASLQKIATLTGSGNSSASGLAESVGKGTGTSKSRFTVSELI